MDASSRTIQGGPQMKPSCELQTCEVRTCCKYCVAKDECKDVCGAIKIENFEAEKCSAFGDEEVSE